MINYFYFSTGYEYYTKLIYEEIYFYEKFNIFTIFFIFFTSVLQAKEASLPIISSEEFVIEPVIEEIIIIPAVGNLGSFISLRAGWDL